MNIFKKFRPKENHPATERSVYVAMIALPEAALPDQDKLASCLREKWPDKPRFANFEKKDEIICFAAGLAIGAIALMPAPIPSGDVQASCAASLPGPRRKKHSPCTRRI